jgi:hypothetical protein
MRLASITRKRPSEFGLFKRRVEKNLDAANFDAVVLWGHLGLGDQICSARSIELWSQRVDLLIIPVKMRNLIAVTNFFGYLTNIAVLPMESDEPSDEHFEVHKIALQYSAAVVDAGRGLYSTLRRIFPEYGINRALAMSAVTNPTVLSSIMLGNHLADTRQTAPPKHPYAFIDHHPGIQGREIPRTILEGLEKKGLVLVYNSLGAPLSEHLLLMRYATELHMVSSAPLCLALTAGTSATTRVAYRSQSQALLLQDYGSDWSEVNIGMPAPKDNVRDTLQAPRSLKRMRDFFLKLIPRLITD